ncbi:PREDICTED: orexin receptor type 1-like [Papilio xuthus]|uniref:Orexin receptor type 1-like n=1 Tax=Papilio xuthus TaxID=66420 RepID=A0AAJ6ZP13_PAPXU|nr:PREDICTED: orexin receptor type 1-like [Papilio xuthus]
MNFNLIKCINSIVIVNLFLINIIVCFETKANEEFALYRDKDVATVKVGDTEEKVLSVRFKRAVQRDRSAARTATLEDIDRKQSANQSVIAVNGTDEPCVGSPEFCNLTKEEYVKMLQEYIYPQTYEWVLIGTHSAVFVIGLVGNALVCIAVYRNHTMRTVTNYFIVNLAVADFMVILFCLPPTVLWDVTETWFLGDALCKILLYFQSVSVTVSVLTLTFISLDRWYAVCFPLEFKSTTGRATTAILIIWTVSLVFNAPELAVLTTVQTVPLRFGLRLLVQCMPTWSATSDLVWHVIKVLFIYTIPLLVMTVAYRQIVRVLWRADNVPGQAETVKLATAEQSQLRSRRKAAKMLVAVVAMFAVCYFPVHLLSVLRYTLDMEQSDVVTCVALLSHVMCYANSAINPLIYNFMSGKYRREFRRAFCCSAQEHEALTSSSRSRSASRTASRSKRLVGGYLCHPAAPAAGNAYRNTYMS